MWLEDSVYRRNWARARPAPTAKTLPRVAAVREPALPGTVGGLVGWTEPVGWTETVALPELPPVGLLGVEVAEATVVCSAVVVSPAAVVEEGALVEE